MKEETKPKTEKKDTSKKCGIIMPIASNPDYPKEHWKEVLTILVEAIGETEFEPRLVSDDVAIGLIHERIVNNIYNDEIVVCDVSSKNPNVMFELGLRLAFDKPTIIIKDEKTGYSFDTGVIEHITYPSSLRFKQIVEFKDELIKRINATYKKSIEEANYSPFLKSFGNTIVPAKIKEKEIAESSYIISRLEVLTNEVQMLRLNQISENPTDSFNRAFSENSLARKVAIRKTINDFLEINNHLSEDEIIENFIFVLKDEIYSNYQFRPNTIEIRNLVRSYFRNKEHNIKIKNSETINTLKKEDNPNNVD